MSSSSPINSMLAKAKGTLAHANRAFPSSAAPKSPTPPIVKPPTAPKISIPSTGEPEKGIGSELAAKAANVKQYTDAPKMHKGGPVTADGVYSLKAGEHVLAKGEADKARKHALMSSGMKSLAMPGVKADSKKK